MPSITQVLKTDHDKMRALVEQLEIGDDMNSEERMELLGKIRDEVIPHARAEEAVLYNSMRESNGPTEMVYHGYAEHAEAEVIMAALAGVEAVGVEWKALVEKLKHELLHHFEEEEEELFVQADQFFTKEETEMMGDAFTKLKAKIREQGPVDNVIDFLGNLMPIRSAGALRKLENPSVRR